MADLLYSKGTVKRQTVSDEFVTDEMVTTIVNMVYGKLDNVFDVSKKDVIKILMKTKLSNATMARVVNQIFPSAQCTKGSVASMIKHIRTQESIIDNLLSEVEKDIYG